MSRIYVKTFSIMLFEFAKINNYKLFQYVR